MKAKKRMTTKEESYVFGRSLVIYLIVLVVLVIMTNLIVVKFCFTGISAEDVKFNTIHEQVTYEVTGVKNEEILDGIKYTVSFRDIGGIAPTFESEMSALPTGLDIGKQYPADWVCVTASYGKQSVVKNLTSMEYTGTTISDSDIENAKILVGETLIKNCANVTTNGGFIFILASCVVGIVLAIVGTGIIEKKIANAEPTYWQSVMNEYRTLENTVVDDENGKVQYRTEGEQLFYKINDDVLGSKPVSHIDATGHGEKDVINVEPETTGRAPLLHSDIENTVRQATPTMQERRSTVQNPFGTSSTPRRPNPFSKDNSDTFTKIGNAREMGVVRQKSDISDGIHKEENRGIVIDGERLVSSPRVGKSQEGGIIIDRGNVSGARIRRTTVENPFLKPKE